MVEGWVATAGNGAPGEAVGVGGGALERDLVVPVVGYVLAGDIGAGDAGLPYGGAAGGDEPAGTVERDPGPECSRQDEPRAAGPAGASEGSRELSRN